MLFPRTQTARRAVFATGLGLLAILSIAAALQKLDLERFHSDPELVSRLQTSLSTRRATLSSVADWPQWRGPNRDGLSLETGLIRQWPLGGPPLLWQQNLGRGFSCPVVVRDRVFTLSQETGQAGAEEVVACWDAVIGKRLWRFSYPNQYEERMGSGPRSTPAVDGDYIYTVGPTGIFHCLRADTGEKVWRHNLLDEFHALLPQYGVAFSPLVEGDLVYVVPGGGRGNSVAAFDKRTGKPVWQALDDAVGYSSPIVVTAAGVRQLLILTNTALVSLSPRDGSAYWRYPWETANGFNIATPVAFGDYVYMSTGYGKGCCLLEVAAHGDGSLRARPVYEHNRLRNYFSSSVCYENFLYGFDNADLVCMDIRTGKICWREKGIRTFKKGSLLIAGGDLIILGESGKLALAEASPSGYREKATVQVSTNKCWTVPVVASGRLYVRDEGCLRCLDLRNRAEETMMTMRNSAAH
jgi:outer membrane protein assembly factor BamB